LLNLATFSGKTGVKNSYAPRVPLSGIFVRTRDHVSCIATVQAQIGQENYTFAFLPFSMYGNDTVSSNKLGRMNQVASTRYFTFGLTHHGLWLYQKLHQDYNRKKLE
jgi:hypothetical protein